MKSLSRWLNPSTRRSFAASDRRRSKEGQNRIDAFYRSGFLVLDEGGEASAPLAEIEREFDALVSEPSLIHHEYENGFYTAVGGDTVRTQATRYPALSKFLSDHRIQEVISGYLDRFYSDRRLVDTTVLHEQLDLEVNSRPGSTNNSKWHFDRMPSIKTCLFLTDVSHEPDAFLVIPGSHFIVRDRFLNFLRKNPDPLFVDNFVDFDAPVTPLSFRIRPGTIILFDTLTMHRGGVMRSDRVRKAIRTVTWPPRLSAEYFTWTSPGDEVVPRLSFTSSHPFDRTGQKMEDRRHLFAG